MTDPALRELAKNARAWPFEEARKVVKRLAGKTPDKGYVLFETGYGPSGLPHIGTFGEVARTTWVRRAFEMLSDVPTRLFAFSDDMDGMRRVPSNVPNQDMLQAHLGKPLTAVPDPFGTHESFAITTTRGCVSSSTISVSTTTSSADRMLQRGPVRWRLREILAL